MLGTGDSRWIRQVPLKKSENDKVCVRASAGDLRRGGGPSGLRAGRGSENCGPGSVSSRGSTHSTWLSWGRSIHLTGGETEAGWEGLPRPPTPSRRWSEGLRAAMHLCSRPRPKCSTTQAPFLRRGQGQEVSCQAGLQRSGWDQGAQGHVGEGQGREGRATCRVEECWSLSISVSQ